MNENAALEVRRALRLGFAHLAPDPATRALAAEAVRLSDELRAERQAHAETRRRLQEAIRLARHIAEGGA